MKGLDPGSENFVYCSIFMIVYKTPETSDSRVDKTQKKCATLNSCEIPERLCELLVTLKERLQWTQVDPPSFNWFLSRLVIRALWFCNFV